MGAPPTDPFDAAQERGCSAKALYPLKEVRAGRPAKSIPFLSSSMMVKSEDQFKMTSGEREPIDSLKAVYPVPAAAIGPVRLDRGVLGRNGAPRDSEPRVAHQTQGSRVHETDAVPAWDERGDKVDAVRFHASSFEDRPMSSEGQRATPGTTDEERVPAATEARTRDENEVRRLTAELSETRNLLNQRNEELKSLKVEFGWVRAMSSSLRGAADRIAQGSIWPPPEKLPGRFLAQSLSEYFRGVLCVINRSAEAEAIRKSGLFDPDWYLRQNPDVAAADLDPLQHYLKFGAWEGRDPHPLFDGYWYGSAYPEIKTQPITSLGHFVTIGAAKGYNPNPLFHTAWYMAQNPDVVTEGANPLRHYMRHGMEPGRNPNPLFDSAWYLERNPDVCAANENPLCHYLRCGIAELRDPHPLFNTRWYLQEYDRVVLAGFDALEHYLITGAFEGCRPGPGHRDDEGPVDRKRTTFPPSMEGKTIDLNSSVGTELPRPSEVANPTDIQLWRMRLKAKPSAPRFTGVIGVFVHLYHEDLVEEIASQLLAIKFDYKVYVSTNSEAKKRVIELAFRKAGIEAVIKVLPNRGWDISALLLGFKDEIKSHEICLKVHGKKSRHASPEFGERWRKYLLSGLLWNRKAVSQIVDNFMAFPELGVVMLPHWRKVARQAGLARINYGPMTTILSRADLSISPSTRVAFPSGSMFWFRSEALLPLLDLGLTWVDFQGCRARNHDGTIAHGIERSILIFAAKAGFRWALVPRRWRYGLRSHRGKLRHVDDIVEMTTTS